MYGMTSTQHMLLQYVLVTCNEQDPGLVFNLTYEGAISMIQQAGLQVTEWETASDIMYEDDDGED